MSSAREAARMIESLRKGLPPFQGVQHYSVGQDTLLAGIQRHHLSYLSDRALIRFVSGSWGSGKTHFLRQLRQLALHQQALVATVELNAGDTSLNRLDRILFAIFRQLSLPASAQDPLPAANPLAAFLEQALQDLLQHPDCKSRWPHLRPGDYQQIEQRLLQVPDIDIDFKKMLLAYWQTFLPDYADPALQARQQAEIRQWFVGEGQLTGFRRRFGIHKMIERQNARQMLQSLVSLVRLLGYPGLVILFDEAEQSYSLLRKSVLREAHNTLLALLNQIDSLQGVMLVYATTPDFFHDPKHGIVTYGALLGRIGKPDNRPPRALDTIWNLDALRFGLSDYQAVALQIASLHSQAYPEQPAVPAPLIQDFVAELLALHPALSAVRFWRILVTALIAHLDDLLDGESRQAEVLYDDIMERLRDT